jgi:hypothetical protein
VSMQHQEELNWCVLCSGSRKSNHYTFKCEWNRGGIRGCVELDIDPYHSMRNTIVVEKG